MVPGRAAARRAYGPERERAPRRFVGLTRRKAGPGLGVLRGHRRVRPTASCSVTRRFLSRCQALVDAIPRGHIFATFRCGNRPRENFGEKRNQSAVQGAAAGVMRCSESNRRQRAREPRFPARGSGVSSPQFAGSVHFSFQEHAGAPKQTKETRRGRLAQIRQLSRGKPPGHIFLNRNFQVT